MLGSHLLLHPLSSHDIPPLTPQAKTRKESLQEHYRGLQRQLYNQLPLRVPSATTT